MNPNMPKTHPNYKKDSLYCSTCQWFSSGYNGKNCQNVRGVDTSTPACIEYTEIFKDPYHEITKDKYIEAMRQDYRSGVLKIDESIFDELNSYIISADKLKNEYASDSDIQALDEALTDVIAHRERISTIYFAIIDAKKYYEKLEEQSDMWLYSKYTLMRNLKNEAMRNIVKNRLIPERMIVSNNISKALKLIEYVNSKIDSNDRTVQRKLDNAMRTWSYKRNLSNLK